jgi:hypothetical protein
MLPKKVFQVLKPIGGVVANPSNFWANKEVASKTQNDTIMILLIII